MYCMAITELLIKCTIQSKLRTPYEKLHEEKSKGNLPRNLHIQLRAKRFDPEGDSEFDKVTAFPRSSTIIVDPENRKKYKDVWAVKKPWINSQKEIEEYQRLEPKRV